MGFLDAFVPRTPPVEQRYSWQDYVHDTMTFGGNQYRLSGLNGSRPDYPDDTFEAYVEKLHKGTSIISAAAHQRALLVSQVVPQWRRFSDGDLFGNRSLSVFENPHNGSRAEFFYRLELDATYGGSAFICLDEGRVRRLSPDRCSVVLASPSSPDWDGDPSGGVCPYDAEVVGLLYHESRVGGVMQAFLPGEFVIWRPEPDPINFWRGMSWVQSCLQEVVADQQATDHQQKFFENAATPSVVVMMDPSKSPQETQEFARVFNSKFSGHRNAYKSWFLGGGTDVKIIGSTLESLSLRDLTGGFENRVAVRSRIPNVILGGREGLSGSSLNTGNYNSARRMFADGWLAPHLDGLMSTLAELVPAPSNAELTWDRDRVLFLQEDVQQQADINSTKAATIRTLIDGGFDPESVVAAVDRGKLDMLVHTGKLSVQLQPPDQGTLTEDGEDVDVDEVAGRSVSRSRDSGFGEQLRIDFHNHTHVTRSDVTVEPAQVTVEGANVSVEPQIDVHVPEQRVEMGPMVVNVEPTPMVVNVEPTPVTVRNEIDVDTPPAQVTVVGEDRRSKFKVRRDGQGRISEVDEQD